MGERGNRVCVCVSAVCVGLPSFNLSSTFSTLILPKQCNNIICRKSSNVNVLLSHQELGNNKEIHIIKYNYSGFIKTWTRQTQSNRRLKPYFCDFCTCLSSRVKLFISTFISNNKCNGRMIERDL